MENNEGNNHNPASGGCFTQTGPDAGPTNRQNIEEKEVNKALDQADTFISTAYAENEAKKDLNDLRNPAEKEIRESIFEIMLKTKMQKSEIASKLGWSQSYLTMLLNNFSKYWPKTKVAQERILTKIRELRNG